MINEFFMFSSSRLVQYSTVHCYITVQAVCRPFSSHEYGLRVLYHALLSLRQAMQEHSQQEFEATLRNAFDSSKQTKDGGWFTVTCVRERAATCDGKVSLHLVVSSPMIDGEPCHDFENDPWSRHAVQFQGFEVPAIVKVCAPAGGKESAKLILYSPHGYKATPKKSDHLFTRVRSLGYVGSFLREYDSTVRLFSGLAVSSLLPVVASPSGTIHGHRNVTGNGTFVDVNSGSLKTSTVPLNEAQRRAVRSLRGGLDIIVGPPGGSWRHIGPRSLSSRIPWVMFHREGYRAYAPQLGRSGRESRVYSEVQ